METVELWFAAYETEVISSVQIALGSTVKQLREAIVAADEWNDRPSELTLYVAKEAEQSSMLLKDDTNLNAILKETISDKYQEMRPSWRLRDYYGSTFKPRKKDIHVLVKRPLPPAPSIRTFECEFSPRNPKPLLTSAGTSWDY